MGCLGSPYLSLEAGCWAPCEGGPAAVARGAQWGHGLRVSQIVPEVECGEIGTVVYALSETEYWPDRGSSAYIGAFRHNICHGLHVANGSGLAYLVRRMRARSRDAHRLEQLRVLGALWQLFNGLHHDLPRLCRPQLLKCFPAERN